MCYRMNGLLSYYVLLSACLIQVQWRPVCPAPVHTSCDVDFKQTKDLARLVEHEARELLGEYIEFHKPSQDSVPNEVPDSTISGVTISEKLQDIYVKNVLFYLHILKVEELGGHSEDIVKLLSVVKDRLSFFLAKVKATLQEVDPEAPLPTTPAPLQLPHKHDYSKKVYGWGVILRLKEWAAQVWEVLEATEVCDKQNKV